MSANIYNLIGKAPAKLIISGEHSVVYGAAALVVAVKKFTEARFLKPSEKGKIKTFINNPQEAVFSYPSADLRQIKELLDQRYQVFLNNKIKVGEILNRPSDLIIYVLSHFAEKFEADLLGISQIPLGAGMGSSASAIAAMTMLCEQIFNKKFSLEERFNFVRYCERLQHGKGSALDASAVVFGGVNFLEKEKRERIEGVNLEGWYYFLDGTPQSTTGECVEAVRAKFHNDKPLWADFDALTQEIKQDLLNNKLPLNAIKENQRLLEKIGVVAEPTQELIKQITKLGFAAKVSGAGTIKGNNSGMVLVLANDYEKIKELKKKIPKLQKLELEE